jgi:excisionase family DNA binding protein
VDPETKRLFIEYLADAKGPAVAAAMLVLAEVLRRPPPEPIIVEPADCNSYTVKETAARLNLSSRQVYQMCLAGQLRCFRAGRCIRIPLDQIECYEARQ